MEVIAQWRICIHSNGDQAGDQRITTVLSVDFKGSFGFKTLSVQSLPCKLAMLMA